MDKTQKATLLADMKNHPSHYDREAMYEYIVSRELTQKDLVVDENILTDKAFEHIIKYPSLSDEQRPLALTHSYNPYSKDGNLDILLFGSPGVGKRMFLSRLLSLHGKLGFCINCGHEGVEYAIELRNYSRACFIPPSCVDSFIQVIEASFRNDRGQQLPISLIEMPGEKLIEFFRKKKPKGFADLGPGAEGILNNNNSKIVFIFIDSKEYTSYPAKNSTSYVRNCDVISELISQFASNPSFMEKVQIIHLILTKSDLSRDNETFDHVQDKLIEHGYGSFIHSLNQICQEYHINFDTGCRVGIYPFSVGKFMPGDMYEFDESDSLKILQLINAYIPFPTPKTKWTNLIREWLNSD